MDSIVSQPQKLGQLHGCSCDSEMERYQKRDPANGGDYRVAESHVHIYLYIYILWQYYQLSSIKMTKFGWWFGEFDSKFQIISRISCDPIGILLYICYRYQEKNEFLPMFLAKETCHWNISAWGIAGRPCHSTNYCWWLKSCTTWDG